MQDIPLIIERTLPAPVANVWRALTDHQQMKQWYFDLAEFKAEVGFQFQFEGVGKDGHTVYVHHCEIKEVIPERKLAYSWRYEGFSGDSLVVFELFPEGENTKVRLTHKGTASFAANGPDFFKQSFEEGWTYILGTSLMEYVKKQPA